MKRMCLILLVVGAFMVTLCPSHAQGGALYAISGARYTNSVLYSLDPGTGAVIQTVGSAELTGDQHIVSLAFDPCTGVLYGYINVYETYNLGALATIDVNTGLASVIGEITPLQVPDLTFSPSRILYGWTEGGAWSDDLVTFNTATGGVTWVGESGIGTWATGPGCDSAGNLYVKNGESLYSVNPVTGEATFLTYLSSYTNNTLAFDENDNLYSIYRGEGTTYLLTIDIDTGLVTTIGDIGVPNISALAFQPKGTPSATEAKTWGRIKAQYK
ncbi:MAG: hypothetical protein QME66_02270 [Candidatus Eisenbacteria bacterium]|nr:hypothetical protein [Candidatus Eisenbacteria bacterium]